MACGGIGCYDSGRLLQVFLKLNKKEPCSLELSHTGLLGWRMVTSQSPGFCPNPMAETKKYSVLTHGSGEETLARLLSSL